MARLIGIGVRLAFALVLVTCAAERVTACGDDFNRCEESGAEAAAHDLAHQNAVNGLTSAFTIADSNDNNKFAGIEQRIDALKEMRSEAERRADPIDDPPGVLPGQVTDITAKFDEAITKLTGSQAYFQEKKAALAAINLEGGMNAGNKAAIVAMKEKFDTFIQKWDAGVEKLTAAKAEITVPKTEEQVKASIEKFKKFIDDDLSPARDALNDTIDPVQERRDNAITAHQEFLCKCGHAVSSFLIQGLAQENRELRAALEAQGISVPDPIVPQGSIDDTDTGGGGGTTPPSTPPTTPPSTPPGGGGEEAPVGRALSAEELSAGLGSVAFANCAAMGYDCSAAAIYGPGGMVSVLAQHITNRDVTNPNLLLAGDTIDFEAVDRANN